jgi:predicted permease
MDIPLVEGRYLRAGDGADGYRAVVVSESFARHWWPSQSALGRRMRQGPFEDWYEIVGVVEDVRYTSPTTEPEEMMYGTALWGPQVGSPPPQPGPGGGPQGPQGPIATRAMDVVVRTTGDPLSMLDVVRREVQAINPRIPLANPRTMTSVVAQSTARTSFTMVVLATAAGVALLLGMVGIYGVVSYVVSQRTREIGVRMALGASAPLVRSMVVRQGMTVAILGVVVGLVAAVGMSSVIASLLFGVSAMDPLTYAGVALALSAVAALASWLPAQRATRVDPSTALRSE